MPLAPYLFDARQLYAFGNDFSGQLGDVGAVPVQQGTGSPLPQLTPEKVLTGKTITIAAGGRGTGYALGSNGTVYAFGADGTGEYGNGTTSATANGTPVTVTGLSAL